MSVIVRSASDSAAIKVFATGSSAAALVIVLVITQFLDEFKIRLTSQFIRGNSRVLQNLLKYFNGIIISTFLLLGLSGVLPVNFILKFK